MRKRNIVVWLCAVTVAASLAAGCGQKAEGASQETAAAGNAEVSQDGTENSVPKEPGLREGVRIVRVTEITENTITAEEGTFERPSPPDIPEDRKEEGSGKERDKVPDDGSGPEEGGGPGDGGGPGEGKGGYDENGNDSRGERQPDDGQRPKDGAFGRFGGGNFESSGETVTFQVTDSTEILLGSFQESQQGTVEDISVGSILEIILDSQDRAEQILINNVRTEDGMPPEAMEETEI